MITILFYGDIVGKPGRVAAQKHLPVAREQFAPDIVIANGENASGGIGIEPANADELFELGIDVLTSGNHIWQRKGIQPYLNKNAERCIRPYNFPDGVPGKGWTVFTTASEKRIAIINLIGRVFMPQFVDCPFHAFDTVLKEDDILGADVVFVDFHAEATSEKQAFGFHADGKASVIVGTHTHVQTTDSYVLSKGTAYISDVGMCGVRESVIGFKHEQIVERFLTSMPTRMEVGKGMSMVNAVVAKIDEDSKKVTSFERIYELHS